MIKIGVMIVALVSFLNAGWFANLFDSTPTPPITVPIDLSKVGSKVEFDVRLPQRYGPYKGGAYYIWIEFIYTDEVKNGHRDANIAQKIVGYNTYSPRTGKQIGFTDYEFAKRDLGDLIDENYNCDGTIIPVKVRIYRIGKKKKKTLLVDKIYKTKGDNGGWRYHKMRAVGSYKLSPGKYKVVVIDVDAIIAMKNRKADIRFGRSGSK